MAKPSLQNLLITNTFQDWFDRTNQVVTIMKSEVLTASAAGDSTGSELVPFSSTLIGTFTANTVFAKDLLRVTSISPDIGDTTISISSPVTITSSIGQVVSTLFSTSGPRQLFSSGPVVWRSGFESTSNNNFVINTGAGALKFVLTQSGNLTIPGTFTSNIVNANTVNANLDGNVTGNVTGNLTGNVTGDVTGDLTGNVDGNVDGNLTGNVTGNVTGNLTGNVTGNVTGNASSASVLQTPRSISMTGDVTWSISSFNGSANVSAISTIANNSVSNAKFRNSSGLSVVGRSANTSGNVSDITAANDFSILRRSGTALSFGAINIGHDNVVANNVLRIKNGGTGRAALTVGQIVVGNGINDVHISGNLFWDITNSRLGLGFGGSGSPTERLDVNGNAKISATLMANSISIDSTQVISSSRILRNVTVDSTSAASAAQAQAGTDNTSIMTPLRTEQNVPRAIARMERADIGSYALLGTRDGINIGVIEFGTVISGEFLYPMCILGNAEVNNNNHVININESFNIAGNWMCMGRLVTSNDNDLASATLFKRVS